MIDLQKRSRGSQRGYSLSEALVVIAIVGMVSVVTVPNFIALHRSAKVKSSVRQFSSDIRNARQRAISLNRKTMISVEPTATGRYSYWLFENTSGNTWAGIPRFPEEDPPTAERELEPTVSTSAKTIYVASTTFTDVAPAGDLDTLLDVIFLPNGSIQGGTEGTIVLRTDKPISKQVYTLRFTAAGSLRVE